MVMDTLQIRMNKGLLKRLDIFVKEGIYSNRSDVIRDAVRHFVWEKEIGSLKDKFDSNKSSVEVIKEIRKKLSKEPINLEEINNL